MKERDFRILTMELNGTRFVYAAPLDGRDPMEMTLGEWTKYKALSAEAATSDLLLRLQSPRQQEHPIP